MRIALLVALLLYFALGMDAKDQARSLPQGLVIAMSKLCTSTHVPTNALTPNVANLSTARTIWISIADLFTNISSNKLVLSDCPGGMLSIMLRLQMILRQKDPVYLRGWLIDSSGAVSESVVCVKEVWFMSYYTGVSFVLCLISIWSFTDWLIG